MEANELRDKIEQYKRELMAMAQKNPEQVTDDVLVPEENVVTEEEELAPAAQTQDDNSIENGMEAYQNFLRENPEQGFLKIQAYSAREAFPTANVKIEISKEIGGVRRLFYSLRTDQNGIVDGIILPAPMRDMSLAPGDGQPFSTYQITATHPAYQPEEYRDVPIFSGVKSIQPIILTIR